MWNCFPSQPRGDIHKSRGSAGPVRETAEAVAVGLLQQFVFQLQAVGVQNEKDLQWCKTQNLSKTEAGLKYLKIFFYFNASEELSSSYCLKDHCIVPK